MRSLKTFALMLSGIICNGFLFAQSDSIDLFVKHIMQQRSIPGLQLAIVRDGKIVKTGNYGFANMQDSVLVSDRTVFSINSITKAFTGVAIMQLQEAGLLQLESPLSNFMSDLPQAWNGVTLLQLLAHTSGIPDIVDEEESTLIAVGEAEAWKKVLALPMDFKPGEKFRYNQTNYLLLGKVIDKLSGISFTEFIKQKQLEPAGMLKTIRAGFGANKNVVPHAADGYTFRQGKMENIFFSFPPSLQTAAGMSSTSIEMANWIIALQNGTLLRKKISLNSLWLPFTLNDGRSRGFGGLLNGYAVGWPTISRLEHPAVAAVGGGRSAVFVYPKDNLSIIVLTNLAGASPEGFIDELAGFYFSDMKEANGFGLSPAVRKLREELELSGYKSAERKVKHMQATTPHILLDENELNKWGYQLLRQGRLQDALEIFKLNVSLHPKSSNVYDSLGEIYAELGNTKLAIANYEQALLLDPSNTALQNVIRKLKAL